MSNRLKVGDDTLQTVVFWISMPFFNISALLLTIFWQLLSQYGPQAISREERIDSVIHGLKTLPFGVVGVLIILTPINYFILKARYAAVGKKVIWLAVIHIVLNLFFFSYLSFLIWTGQFWI